MKSFNELQPNTQASVIQPAHLSCLDPLEYLPCSTISDHYKGQAIYNPGQPPAGFYMVIDGRVRVSRVSGKGNPTLLGIYTSDQLFGEGGLVGAADECAVAMVRTKVMSWTTDQIETLSLHRPELAMALLQAVIRRALHYVDLIQSHATDGIERRLARTLLRFSRQLGTVQEDGSVSMIALTHELLSESVGTSREIITHHMTKFRRQGYLTYSRQGIVLQPERFSNFLDAAEDSPADANAGETALDAKLAA